MRRLLAGFILTTCLMAALLLPASAQNIKTQECGSFDTTVTTTTAFALLGSCTITAGPKGIIFVIASGECTCGAAGENLQLWVGSGSSPVNGSNFLGSVSGGVLTVTSLIPGIGASPWLIQAGQLLTGGTGVVFTPTAITGQLSGTTGGVGTYSIANNALSEPGGTNLYTLNAIPGGLVALTPNEQQTGCSAGFVITSISGAITNASPNATYWIGLAMSSVTNGQSSTFNNSQWTVLTY